MNAEQDFASQTVHGRWMAADHEPGLVSIVVPTYNRSMLLPYALESTLRQTYRPIEVLVIDDGSTDETTALLDRWKREHEDAAFRVRLLSQSHGGAPAARNLGLIESRGEFIQFLDSDDILCPEKTEASVNALKDTPAVDYVFSRRVNVEHARMEEFARARMSNRIVTSPPSPVGAGKMHRMPPNAVLGFYRRTLCRRLGPWNESLVRHQDWEYTTGVASTITQALSIEHPLYAIRLHQLGRIRDLRSRPIDALDARLAAALAAEERGARSGGGLTNANALRLRLRNRYWQILRQSVVALSARHLVSAVRGLKANIFASGRRVPAGSGL
ncbi:MAG: glycosyltransferase family A protein [bacterium]